MALPPLTVRALLPQLLQSNAAVVTAVTVGDVGCQALEGRLGADGVGWDSARTGRMAIAAFFVTGPLSFAWNQFLERRLPGRDLRQVFRKMLANGLFAPIQIATSFTTITLLSGRTVQDAQRKVRQDLPLTFMVGTAYWPGIGFLQFRFVPLQYRPVVGSVAGAVYNMFFSSMANRPVDAPAPAPAIPSDTRRDAPESVLDDAPSRPAAPLDPTPATTATHDEAPLAGALVRDAGSSATSSVEPPPPPPSLLTVPASSWLRGNLAVAGRPS